MRGRRRRNNYKFTEKTHSKKGKIALAVAMTSLIAGIICVRVSFVNRGAGGPIIGLIGIVAAILSIVALVLSVQSLKDDNSFKAFPIAATACSGVMLFGWLYIFIIGFIV